MDRPELIAKALSMIMCLDDCVAPEPNEYLCTEENNHTGPHIAKTTSATLETWPRGKGRPAQFLRAKYGIKRGDPI